MNISPPTTAAAGAGTGPSYITSLNTGNLNLPSTTVTATVAQTTGTVIASAGYGTMAGGGNQINIAAPTSGVTAIVGNGAGTYYGNYNTYNPKPSPIIINSSNNKEVVRLNPDGSVTWNKEINIDEAARAFAESLRVGAELASGITEGVKRRMRDSVFEDLIAVAKEKGSLTADDLTYLLQASKIVEKLKGGRE